MKPRRFPAGATIAILALVFLAPAAATGRSMQFAPVPGQFVNVNVGFNTRVQLADLNEETLTQAQQTGRKYIYSMVSKECAVLQATIAKTCRLNSLNISAQVREQKNMPASLHLNGNAQFAITLKDDEPG
jgi:hypothetical protein